MKKKKVRVNKPTLTFEKTDARKFIQIDLDYTDVKLFNQDLSELIRNVSDAIVYVNIRVAHENVPRLPIEDIKKLCKDAYILRPISPTIIKETKLRSENIIKKDSLEECAKVFLKVHKPKNVRSIYDKFRSIVRGDKIAHLED